MSLLDVKIIVEHENEFVFPKQWLLRDFLAIFCEFSVTLVKKFSELDHFIFMSAMK